MILKKIKSIIFIIIVMDYKLLIYIPLHINLMIKLDQF